MKKTAFLFPGQGAQYLGMEKTLCQEFPVARDVFEEASDALGFDLKKLCSGGSLDELTKTENAQPAILTTSVAAYKAFAQNSDRIPIPQYMAGHSLGEYTALTCSGALRFADAVKIVRKRGQMMQRAIAFGEGAMVSVGDMDADQIEHLCLHESLNGRVVAIAGYNSAAQTVISGHADAVQKVSEHCASRGGSVIPLKVSAPFHSPLMGPAAQELKQELARYHYQSPSCKVLSNVTGLPYQGVDEFIESLSLQMTQPVLWHQSIQYLLGQGVAFCLELGPRKTLRNLMKSHAQVEVYSFDDPKDIESCYLSVKKNIKHITTFITRSMAVAVSTKNNNWDEEEYERGMVEPFRRMKAMQEKLEAEGRVPNWKEMSEVMGMLSLILVTKKVRAQERTQRLSHLLEETGMVGLMPGSPSY